jgi:hypothetical protein
VAIYISALQIGVPVGALIQGKLASIVPLRSVIAGSGVALLVFAVFTMVHYDRLRPLDQSLLDAQTEELLARRPAIVVATDAHQPHAQPHPQAQPWSVSAAVRTRAGRTRP